MTETWTKSGSNDGVKVGDKRDDGDDGGPNERGFDFGEGFCFQKPRAKEV